MTLTKEIVAEIFCHAQMMGLTKSGNLEIYNFERKKLKEILLKFDLDVDKTYFGVVECSVTKIQFSIIKIIYIAVKIGEFGIKQELTKEILEKKKEFKILMNEINLKHEEVLLLAIDFLLKSKNEFNSENILN